MKRCFPIFTALLIALLPFTTKAQEFFAANLNQETDGPVTTIFLMPNVYPAVVIEGDTVACMWLTDFIKYPPTNFHSTRDQVAYARLIRDVKKTLPYAKEIAAIITETYEYMETLPDEKSRQTHLNQMEKYLKDEYTPSMKKMTKAQGQLLMKLVDRETNSSSYQIIDAFMGSFKAWTYNLFAGMFGNSLKVRYNPTGEDHTTERICVLVEQGGV